MPESPHKSRFAVNLDREDNDRFDRLVRDVGEAVGRVRSHRGRRLPSRADLLRAMLTVTDVAPLVRDAVHDEVRADVIRRVGPTDEIGDISHDLHRLAGRLDERHRDALADVAAGLDEIAGSLYDDRRVAAQQLGRAATLGGAIAGTCDDPSVARPVRALVVRLRVLQDALYPVEKVTCTTCGHRVRVVVGTDAVARPEQHQDQQGSICPGA